MAVSYLKKNKNLMARTLKKLSRIENYRGIEYSSISTSKSANLTLYAVRVITEFETKIKVVEEKDKVYIGLDLTKGRSSYSDVYDEVYNQLYSCIRYSYKNDDIHKFFVENEGITRDKINDDKKVLTEHPVFKEFISEYEKLYSDCKILAELKKGEWPRLNDRSILPLLVIDKDSGEADYCNNRWGSSTYRKDRDRTVVGMSNYDNVLSQLSYSTPCWNCVEIKVSM